MKAIAVVSLSLLVLVSTADGRPAAQQPTFSARANTVRVDALVMENDRWVEGLTAADFELFDNGVKQQIDLISGQDFRLGLLTFSESIDLRLPISTDLARLKQSLGAMRITNGRTGLIDAALTLPLPE